VRVNFWPQKFLQFTVVGASTFFVLGVCDCFAGYDDIPEQSFIQELPVVLNASRLKQPVSEAPNAMTVIDREMIKASGFRTIPDLFRLVPGMYVSNYTGNHQAIVGYHGVIEQHSRRMQVLVDGRTVYMPPYGGVVWEDLPLQMEDIERIEVIRGPAAASYGGNSIQGVINIVTRDAGALQGFKASATKGNGGISDAAVNFGSRSEKLDYRASLGYRSDTGYDTSQHDPNYDGHTTRLFNLRTSYQPNAIDNFDVQFGYSNGSRGVGSVNSQFDKAHDTHNTAYFQQVTWLRSLDSKNEFKMQYSHTYRDELNNLGVLSDNITVTRHEVEMQHTVHTSPTNRLVWGAQLRQDWVKAPNQFWSELDFRVFSLFAHDEWRINPQWILNTGAMLENNGLGQESASPRLALNYHLDKQNTLRVGTSRAYRNPSVFEERGYYHFDIPGVGLAVFYQSKGGLRPERVTSSEIGYLGIFPEKGLSIDARLYQDKLDDGIYETTDIPLTPPIYFENIISGTHRGLEISTKHRWGVHNQLTINYSRQEINSSREDYEQIAPAYMIGVLYSTSFSKNVAVSMGYYQQATVLPMDRPVYDRQQFTRRIDLRLAKKFKANTYGAEGEIALVVQNPITDKHIDYRRRNEFNRRAYLTASINL